MLAHPEFGGHEALVLEPGQRPAEWVRDGHPTLFIDCMLEVASEHPTDRGGLPPVPRLHHFTPHRPTVVRMYTPAGRTVKVTFVRSGGRVPPAGGGL